MVSILEHQGPLRLIQRLKIYLFVLNNYIGGERMQSTHALGVGVALRNGLPACFPRRIRDAIRSGSLPAIRWWATFLNMYKALNAPYGIVDLSGIQGQPFSGDLGSWSEACLEIWSNLWALGPFPRLSWKVDTSRFTLKAGPSGTNFLTPAEDAWLWFNKPRNYLAEWLETVGEMGALLDFTQAAQIADMDIWMGKQRVQPYGKATARNGREPLGKLSYRLEAAGKIRVFALVDYWTQAILQPLHTYLFKILKLIPSDATFDQTGRLTEFVRRCNQEEKKSFFCYDLKSATDIIPLPLYIELLIPLIGRKLAELWASILVDRDFLVSKPPKGGGSLPAEYKGGKSTVRYTRGQPMGALSSWAGLAIVHHFLVQYSFINIGGQGWFGDYLVLGDDIVIADKLVAEEYLRVCEQFGIIVGLAKSLISEIGLINFANQTFIGPDNISPLSLKEELKARSWSARLALAKRCLTRWFPEDVSVISLLKRVLTVPMWNTYQGLTLRGKDYLGLGTVLALIAQNPFIGASSDKPVGAAELFTWIEGFLNPLTSLAHARSSFLEDLTVVFYQEVVKVVLKRVPLLEVYREALWKVSYHSKQHILRGTSAVEAYPQIGWAYIVEKLIHPQIDRNILDLNELYEQAYDLLGYHQNLISGKLRIHRDQIHGPGSVYNVTGVLADVTINHEAIAHNFKEMISIWLKVQTISAFGVGSSLRSKTQIIEFAQQGAFGSLLKGLIPEEYYRQEENLKLFGQATDPNLVKLPTAAIENTLLMHFGRHATLSTLEPEVSRVLTQQLPAQEEDKPITDVSVLPVSPEIVAAEAMSIRAEPVTSSNEAKGVYSKDGSLERIVGGGRASMLKLAYNHSREIRGLPLIRGEIRIHEVELGKPGFGDNYSWIEYLDPNDDIGAE